MKAVILAGGLGTRISEETVNRPKPMIGIGGRPILWHIMKIYSSHGIHDFVICCGYMGYVIKEYFANYFLHMSDVTFDMSQNSMEIHERHAEPWRVTLVDTGDTSQTGGRLGRVRNYLQDDDAFCFTYGDGLADIDISAEIAFHRGHGKLATVAAVQPPGRFGALELDGSSVSAFVEDEASTWRGRALFLCAEADRPTLARVVGEEDIITIEDLTEHLLPGSRSAGSPEA